VRLTIQLDDEQAAWVDEQAQARDRSKAAVIRQCIVAVQNGEASTVNHGEQGTGVSRDELDALRERVRALERGDDEPTDTPGRGTGFPADEPRGSGGETPAAQGVGHILGKVDSPGFRQNPEAFVDAIGAAVDLLEDGPRTKSEFVDELHADHACGYENTDTWWRRVGRPGLKAHPDVASPPEGASKWRLED
jgi:predicted transcriptional regulator